MSIIFPAFCRFDNPTAHHDSPLARLLTFSYLPILNFWLLLCPHWLIADWTMGTVQPIETFAGEQGFIDYSGIFVVLREFLTCLVYFFPVCLYGYPLWAWFLRRMIIDIIYPQHNETASFCLATWRKNRVRSCYTFLQCF